MIDKLGAGHYETLEEFPVVILCLDAPSRYPVVGYVLLPDGTSVAHSWSADGKCSSSPRRVTEMDLRPVKRKPREIWASVGDLDAEAGVRVFSLSDPGVEGFVKFREVMEDE